MEEATQYVSERKSAQLFVSFWDLCLDNLPEGSFAHRRIQPDDARRRIEQARKAGVLSCVTAADLLAPYGEKRRGDHESLCEVLRKHFGIDLLLRDFCLALGEGADAGYTINALDFARVQKRSPLLIVTCAYALADEDPDPDTVFALQVDPASVAFHLIEAL